MQSDTSTKSHPERLIRLEEVMSMVGLRRSSIYDAMRRKEFPAAIRLSRRCVCWTASSIEAWIENRIKTGGR